MIDETLYENAYSNEEHGVNKLIRLFGRKRDKTVHFYSRKERNINNLYMSMLNSKP